MIKLKTLLNEASDGKMKRHESLLAKSIVAFASKKFGINPKIIVKKKGTNVMFADVALSHNSVNKNKFYLHIRPNTGIEYMIKSMMHELVHVKQISKKELQPAPDWKGIHWKGKLYITVRDYNKMIKKRDFNGYNKLPWEKEAISNEDKLTKEYLKSDYFKSLKGQDKVLDDIIKMM